MKTSVKFSKGDELIALTASTYPNQQQRRLGEVVVVNMVLYCFHCGNSYISFSGNVSAPFNFNCKGCSVVLTSGCFEVTDSRHFCHVEDADQVLQIALKEEDYNKAIAIREYYKSLKPV